jgi:hypothetical protein
MDPDVDVNVNLESHPRAKDKKVPRSDEVIGVDRADELGCLCVPSGDGV